jgi:hypothetical protein
MYLLNEVLVISCIVITVPQKKLIHVVKAAFQDISQMLVNAIILED